MAHLSFQARYVEPILAGRKRSTVRLRTSLRAGDIASMSVGPRPSFGWARITRVEGIWLDALDDEHRESVQQLYPGHQQFVRIHFRLVKESR